MTKILIFGNSGSGKSTLAKKLCHSKKLSHLDLDALAWKPTAPPERVALEESKLEILAFIESNARWVIEGCYSDLLEMALPFSDEIIYMNLPIKSCIDNAKNRPWEPHKYESKEAQDNNLEMLVNWISQYSTRTDTFSQFAHNKLYEGYSGAKRMLTCNQNDI